MSATELPLSPRTGGAARLRALLGGAGYSLDALKDALNLDSELSSRAVDLAVYERRLQGRGVLGALVALFALGRPVPRSALAGAFSDADTEALLGAGILAPEGGGSVRSQVRVMPHGDLLIGSDPIADTTDADHVTGINAPASLLAALTPRQPVEATLDLGCGNGIQAVLAARHSRRVVATDVNPRALAYTEFNAALNAVDHVETRLGSLFEPVAGELFDLIVSNPPYVISPESELTYRDSGRGPGAMCAEIVGSVPRHLRPGGMAVVLVSWGHGSAQEPAEPVRAWLPAGVDSWLLHYQSEDPLVHAAKWNREINDPAAFGAAVDRWVAHCRAEAIDRVAYGAMVMRRREDDQVGWLRVDSLRVGGGLAGRQVARIFAAEDFLRRDGADSRLIDARLRLVPEHRLEQVLTCTAEGWRLASSVLSLSEGIAFRGELEPGPAQLLAALAAGQPVGAAIDSTAVQLDVPAKERTAFRSSGIAMTRRLLELGFLELG